MNGHGETDRLTAHLERGWDLVQRGDFAGALVSAREGLEVDADSPEAHNLMGFAFAAAGRVEEALEHYRQALELDELFVEAMLNAAELLVHPTHDFEAAIRLIDEALDLIEDDDELADAMLLRIEALSASGDTAAAERATRALPEGPFENPGIEGLVGRAKLIIGDFDSAWAHLERAIVQTPDDSEAHYNRALIQEERGDPHGSMVSFLRCREIELRVAPPAWSLSPQQFEDRVQRAFARLPEAMRAPLEGAFVVAVDSPGAEVVADGIDPRAGVLIDLAALPESPDRVGRVFIYKRNIERAATSVLEVEDEILRSLEQELALAKASAASAPPDAGEASPAPPDPAKPDS